MLGDNVVQANFVQFNNDFSGLGDEFGMFLQYKFKGFVIPCLCTSLSKVLLHLASQCKTLFFAFQFLEFG